MKRLNLTEKELLLLAHVLPQSNFLLDVEKMGDEKDQDIALNLLSKLEKWRDDNAEE